MIRRVLFLFGAGASAYSEDCRPCAPPVGDKLFERMLADGFITQALPGECEALFRERGGFERGMELLATRSSFDYNPFIRSMAMFLARFSPGNRNAYVRLFQRLQSLRREFTVATLNYDILIELALVKLGIPVEGDGVSQGPSVIKPHGSCGFLPDFPLILHNVEMGGAPVDIEMELPPKVTLSRETIEQWCKTPGNSLAPVMSFYANGKHSRISPKYIAAHRDAWRIAAMECPVCFIVGVRCNPADWHIWDAIRDARSSVFFINPDPGHRDEFLSWARSVGRNTVKPWCKGFSDAIDDIVSAIATT